MLSTIVSLLFATVLAQTPSAPLEGTAPLTATGDLSAQMVEGIQRYLEKQIKQAKTARTTLWKPDRSSLEAYVQSIEPHRKRLRKILGAVDSRVASPTLELIASTDAPALLAAGDSFEIFAVRWPVFSGVYAEGLLLQPKQKPKAYAVVLPDADETPEMLAGLSPEFVGAKQYARGLAERGCLVLVPTLVDRRCEWSGNPEIGKMTNQPHREYIYRQAFEVGRHILGYEVQKVEAAIDWFTHAAAGEDPLIAVTGHGEGGLIAMYAAALDTRIDAAFVSGAFGPRERIWQEPIYRNVWRLLTEFGDAEVAALIAPRTFAVMPRGFPIVAGPPAARLGRSGGAAPGELKVVSAQDAAEEFERLKALVPSQCSVVTIKLAIGGPMRSSYIMMNDAAASRKAVEDLFIPQPVAQASPLKRLAEPPNVDARQKRQVQELVDHTQRILRRCEFDRADQWRDLAPNPNRPWKQDCSAKREQFIHEVIGKLPPSAIPLQPRTRRIYDKPHWVGYEVILDVQPDVFAWGYLLVPKDLKPGERRPVVVCQHGLEGLPVDVVTEDPKVAGFNYYKAFAAKLAERGFIVYAPHNPYRGQDKFRVLQRMANPLGLSLFSFIIAQHERTLDFLQSLPFVDPKRMGFYGLSYGGKTAMRVPAAVDRYCLSICSADFNEWVKKNATVDSPYSYVFTGEYEIFEWDLGHTFNYAEMAALIAPRPFMVERGHDDGVAPDEWVAYEFAKIRRMYAKLGIPDRAEIEFFNGPHSIHGVGTFDFLHKHLNWPKRTTTAASRSESLSPVR